MNGNEVVLDCKEEAMTVLSARMDTGFQLELEHSELLHYRKQARSWWERDWTLKLRLMHCWFCGSLAINIPSCERALEKYFQDKSPKVRALCCRIIGELYEDAVPYYEQLRLFARDRNEMVQLAARQAIVNLGDDAGELVRIITADFSSQSTRLQMHAIYACRSLSASMIYGLDHLLQASVADDSYYVANESAKTKLIELGQLRKDWRNEIVRKGLDLFCERTRERRFIRREAMILDVILPLIEELVEEGAEVELLQRCAREFTLEFLLDAKGNNRAELLEIVEAIENLTDE